LEIAAKALRDAELAIVEGIPNTEVIPDTEPVG